MNYYEGEDYKERNISSAFQTLTSIFYQGDSFRFTFEKYVAIHLEAYRLLHEAHYNKGAGMDSKIKLSQFILVTHHC